MSDYWVRVAELSDDFAAKKKAVDEFIAQHPDLEGEGEREQFWDLQNAASAAAIRWTEYCTLNRNKR